MRADNIQAGKFYAADDQPERFMLKAEKVEHLRSSDDNTPFIRLHYRWIRHTYAKDYRDEVMTTDFPDLGEEFEYHEDFYVIEELDLVP